MESSEKGANIASEASHALLKILSEKISDADLVDAWNMYSEKEASANVKAMLRGTKGDLRVTNYGRLRNVWFNEIADRLNTISDVGDGLSRQLKPEFLPKAPPKPEPKPEPKPVLAKTTAKARTAQPAVPPVPPGLDTKKLSATEQAILIGKSVQQGGGAAPIEKFLSDLDGDAADALRKAAEEALEAERVQQDFVLWACRKADEEVEKLRQREGEGLWSNAVTVESFKTPGDPLRVVLFRSSTAPFHTSTVKHDFRANGSHVNHKHDLMFRQFDGQKLIRSKVISGKSHEYYVKALRYQEGMYIRGFFVVDGQEKDDLARHYICKNGKVVAISEMEYRDLENQAASRRK
jgi:hypothetical protein